MLPERAEEMLKDYKACYGRCGYLREALEALRMDEKAMMAEHRDDLITGTAKPPDGMPHGTTVGNPTERIAFMLLCGHITQDISCLLYTSQFRRLVKGDKLDEVRIARSLLVGVRARYRQRKRASQFAVAHHSRFWILCKVPRKPCVVHASSFPAACGGI